MFVRDRNYLYHPLSSCSWARRGDVWEAADLIKQMKEEGVPPNIHTYTSYINACCKAGDMQVRSFCIEMFIIVCGDGAGHSLIAIV